MKKIINYKGHHAGRIYLKENINLGIIFPNATGGHFLYTFYSPDPPATLNTLCIDKQGTAHNQLRDSFNFFAGASEQELKKDSLVQRHSAKPDFLGHYYSDLQTRIVYPDHFLISIQVSPEMILLHTYMMLQKTLIYHEKDETQSILKKTHHEQYQQCYNYFVHLKKYNYLHNADLRYTTREIYYEKTTNPRLIRYRRYNRQYVDQYIPFFTKFREYFSADFEQQYNYEKEFIDKYREILYI